MNKELVKKLKHCVRVMEGMTCLVPDPQGWEEMMGQFQKEIEMRERMSH